MCANLTVDDEGKRVVNTNGKEIGVVQDIDADVAYVEPGPEMSESIKSRLRRDREIADGMENYRLDEDYIDEITEHEIRLQRF
ncbi:PRC-barrel domain-containing protein [Natrinema zhouii]|uniref:PRC-barrel domain-containing protein n=1 Tax=Natrinema zhouii TaxID=1710539 RepID=A0A7D6CPQ4_9EURY|nr:PRC-barrel domain-containing protein [Natrinema zhouii]QLK27012.1 PRC-barrel domain-containing protein [Natrinema zhouii]